MESMQVSLVFRLAEGGQRQPNNLEKMNEFTILQELKAVIDLVIQRNAYFAHPENLLLAILTDGQKHKEHLQLGRILKTRSSPTTGKLPRTFEIPKLNFDAKCYIDLINWKETYFDPPILRNETNDNRDNREKR
ncbi:hypothetical protein EVAR_65923_1 [Eumeta japonica]|uniref:Uncharacterized protein n=1 Tax=Eumeta variegata TaxID=151549 RepID=A0A4C2A3F4_EUMVA|nr:hypothetical protein EVAR_65923_1 [Eumeta japonica]